MRHLQRAAVIVTLLLLCVLNLQAQQTPFGLKTEKPVASKGDYVLCPSPKSYERMLEKGFGKVDVVILPATMVSPGENSSTVKRLRGDTYTLPNELLISIPSGQRASPGDVVLTWRQPSLEMQRAVVLGGTETEPVVTYLDTRIRKRSDAKRVTLKPNTFRVLSKQWEAGTTLQLIDPKGADRSPTGFRSSVTYGQLISKDEANVLVISFGGLLRVHPRKNVEPLPISPDVVPNDAVYAYRLGRFVNAKVVSIDKKIGRVFVKYRFAGQDKDYACAFGDLRKSKQ